MVRKAMGIGVISALAALLVVSLATAQPGGGAGGPGGGMGGMGGGRGMGMGRGMVTQESLGATDAEWKVLEPKVTKVQTLSTQVGGRGGMGRGMGMGGPGGGGAAPAAPETEISKARTALQNLVGPDATGTPTTEQINKALAALRQAREKVEQELTAAQADLKKVVTPKQEALLVLANVLK